MITDKPKTRKKRKQESAEPQPVNRQPGWAAAEIHEMMADLDPPEPETEGEAWFMYLNPNARRSIWPSDAKEE